MNLLKLFKKPKNVVPLPVYPAISLDKIPDASALIFYGSPGNKATKTVGQRLYGHKYNPPAFHAALYLTGGKFLNVGKFRTVEKVEDHLRSTRRVDVIVYKRLNDVSRDIVVKVGSEDTTKGKPAKGALSKITDYAITDFLRFGVKWWKPSKKDFCSENVVENLNAGGLHPSDTEPYNTAPWDLVEWAEAHPLEAEIYTLYEGPIFKEKLNRPK